MNVGKLHVITDVAVQSRFTHEELARMATRGRADVIQFRDKALHDDAFIATGLRLRECCPCLIVNDRVDAAVAISADGVHVGRGDVPVSEARRALGPDAIIGATAGSVAEARAAALAGADYVGFGHIFPTRSKHKPTPAQGIPALAEVCGAVSIPVIAIGGITAENTADVMAAGAWGIAVIGAVCAADDPVAATARLAKAVYPCSER